MADTSDKLARFCESNAQRAWRMAYSLLRDGHEAFDCVQQAFVVAARNPGRVPPGDAWPWFCGVVANEARNMRRKRRPQTNLEKGESVEPSDGGLTPGQAAQRDEDGRLLWQALDVLPQAERDAIVLTYVNGLTHALAAKALGVPEKTLDSQVARGMLKLRERLSSREGEIGKYLATLPVAVPPGGWNSALASWQASVVGSAASAGTGAALLGGLMMANKAAIGAALALALGLGLAGGWVISSARPEGLGRRDGEEQSQESRSGGCTRKAPAQPAEAAGTDARELKQARSERDRAVDEALGLKKRVAALENEQVELKNDKAKLAAELQPYRDEQALKGPTFTFGEAGRLDAIREADWKEMAQADAVVQQCLLKMREHQTKGEAIPDQVYIDMQENTEKVRKYEYRTIKKMPTAAEHNGELTHPISMANLLATTLKLAGKPLTAAQVESINSMGEKFESDFSALRAAYAEKTLRSLRMLDEFKLKVEFRDSMLALLSAEQYAIVVIPQIFKIAGLDLHCITLMLIHTSPLITGAAASEISSKFGEFLTKRYSLSNEQKAQLAPILDVWLTDVTPALEPTPKVSARNFTCAQAAQCGAATVRLQTEMLSLLNPTDEQRKQILGDNAFFIARLVQ